MNLLTFIRKNILISNAKIFLNTISILKTKTYKKLPEQWDPEIHDKELLYSVVNKGFFSLDSLPESSEFKGLKVNAEDLKNRLDFLCDFFKEYTSGGKNKKKSQIKDIQNELLSNQLTNSRLNLLSSDSIKKKSKGSFIERDDEGNVIYPIIISPSLKILNLGKLEYVRQNYHSEKNIFPIGYKAVREHPSMVNPNERGFYTCEILDGGERPIFKLTPHTDPENPIIKDTCTGCWIVVCNKINDIQQNRKSKVTISGTERFGLCDIKICKYFQSFPEIKYLKKYKAKDDN